VSVASLMARKSYRSGALMRVRVNVSIGAVSQGTANFVRGQRVAVQIRWGAGAWHTRRVVSTIDGEVRLPLMRARRLGSMQVRGRFAGALGYRPATSAVTTVRVG
jgi:hypothetical protein